MQMHIYGIDYNATKHEVKKAIADALHDEYFFDAMDPSTRQINFKVTLEMDDARGLRNTGQGTLMLPSLRSYNLYNRFKRWLAIDSNEIIVHDRPLRFRRSEADARRTDADYLSKSRYVAPEHEGAREEKVDAVREHIRADRVQFGVLFYPSGTGPRDLAFSSEWEYRRKHLVQPWIVVDYDNKKVRIELGDLSAGNLEAYIVINFAEIEKIGVGHDFGNVFACLALRSRPALEKPYNNTYETSTFYNEAYDGEVDGPSEIDSETTNYLSDAIPEDAESSDEEESSEEEASHHEPGDCRRRRSPAVNTHEPNLPRQSIEYRRQRISCLDEIHGQVMQFATHLRLIFPNEQELQHFRHHCQVVGLPTFSARLEAITTSFFSRDKLQRMRMWMRGFNHDWPFAFQLNALLLNGQLNTEELRRLRPHIEELHKPMPHQAADILRYFRLALSSDRTLNSNLEQCLARVAGERVSLFDHRNPKSVFFACQHVTFTPTRMILEGPTRVQSNSVIRKYWPHRDHFIRVNFLDENLSQYRFDREVDGPAFLHDHVGNVLKGGFEVAGRSFELLGYSNSSLDSHVFWFVSPFDYSPDSEMQPAVRMTADRIRGALGDLSEIKIPAKYAARIGQAFTSTMCSIPISRDQWEEIDEIWEDRENPRSHTDGVGRLSQALMDRIWDIVCNLYPDYGVYGVKPSAVQFRFLGYKGVLAVDPQLSGERICFRPEMRKFKPLICPYCREGNLDFCPHENDQNLHIADIFDSPKRAYLTRDLVSILEDRGVHLKAFMDLQQEAKMKTYQARDSVTQFMDILQTHHMGFQFRLPRLLERLDSLGVDATRNQEADDFTRRVREHAIQHVLCDMKNRARIPVPRSYLLVGVADEGPAYTKQGYENVFQLGANQIFACIQQSPDAEPQWLSGNCIITRSPQVHPGDVQRVVAIGRPSLTEGQICLFDHMKNVVVLPSVGGRSLASCLGGGDLDGDLYYVFQYYQLLPTIHIAPASYNDIKPPGRPFDWTDVCDFITEYMHSDALGILSVRRLIIADQSKHGSHDPRCMRLAELCSDAVDYPKTGRPVDMRTAPGKLMQYNPDWYADEDTNANPLADSYQSDRVLGHLYRGIKLGVIEPSERTPGISPEISLSTQRLNDSTSRVILPLVRGHLDGIPAALTGYQDVLPTFKVYLAELRCIAFTHSLSLKAGSFITEEEIVLGVILMTSSERRMKKDRTYRMRDDTTDLVQQIRRSLLSISGDTPSVDELRAGLRKAWAAWGLSVQNRKLYGAHSFGFIALGVIFDCLDKLAATTA